MQDVELTPAGPSRSSPRKRGSSFFSPGPREEGTGFPLARGRAVLVAVACLTGGAPPAFADDWQTLAPEGRGFSVEMPSAPEHRENLKDPELFAAVDDYGSAAGDGFVMVTIFDFVPGKRELMSEEDIFALGAAMVQPGCMPTAARPLPGGPGAAQEADFACPEGVTLRYRMHLRGDRFWRLAAGGPSGVADGDVADRFFQSFALTE